MRDTRMQDRTPRGNRSRREAALGATFAAVEAAAETLEPTDDRDRLHLMLQLCDDLRDELVAARRRSRGAHTLARMVRRDAPDPTDPTPARRRLEVVR